MAQAKILVIRGGAIGDFVLTLPALAALRENFPQARLEVLGYSHIAQIALTGGLADDVRSIEARQLAGFFAANGGLDEDLAEYFGGFALIISYLYDPDGVFQDNVRKVSKAQFVPGPYRPDESMDLHASEVFLKPLERLAIYAANPLPRLTIPGNVQPDEASIQWVAVHPGSGSDKKNWPEARWAELLRRLTVDTGLNVLLVGGEAEGERLQRLVNSIPLDRREIAFQKPLSELAVLLNQCIGFVGHDSGITHLASALGLPCVVLWGPSKQAVWKPRNDSNVILHHPGGLAELPVEAVYQKITRLAKN